MKISLPSNLNTRVFLPVLIGLLALVVGTAYVGFRTVGESTQQTLDERLVLAHVTSERIDSSLNNMTEILQWLMNEVELDPSTPSLAANQSALQTLYRRLGDRAVYVGLVNRQGVKVWTEPYREDIVGLDLSPSPDIQRVLAGDGPVITKVFSVGESDPSAAILVGIKDKDNSIIGMVCIDLDLSNPRFTELLEPVGLGEASYAEIVDQNGVVLASTRPDRLWQTVDRDEHFSQLIQAGESMVGKCHSCHEGEVQESPADEIVAFAPLSTAPWGVAVRQERAEAMAYSRLLSQRSIIAAVLATLTALAVMLVVRHRLVSPMQTLASACRQITAGNLEHAIPPIGNRELDECGRCFEDLRRRLKASVDEIEAWNQELERKVLLRTEELEAVEQARSELLHRLVVAQEEERKRLARELHDETSQSLTALMIGLETAVRTPATSVKQVKDRVALVQPQIQELLAEINRIVFDLRPAILDDLGLTQAIDWYAESRLRPLGIMAQVWTTGIEKRLPSEVETMVFRIAQEAITNSIRHAHPQNVNIGLSFRSAHCLLIIEDDGSGFEAAGDHDDGPRLHFGLLGMKERASLFGGTLEILSNPGQGTRILLEIPYKKERHDGSITEDSRSVGRRPRNLERRAQGASEPVPGH